MSVVALGDIAFMGWLRSAAPTTLGDIAFGGWFAVAVSGGPRRPQLHIPERRRVSRAWRLAGSLQVEVDVYGNLHMVHGAGALAYAEQLADIYLGSSTSIEALAEGRQRADPTIGAAKRLQLVARLLPEACAELHASRPAHLSSALSTRVQSIIHTPVRVVAVTNVTPVALSGLHGVVRLVATTPPLEAVTVVALRKPSHLGSVVEVTVVLVSEPRALRTLAEEAEHPRGLDDEYVPPPPRPTHRKAPYEARRPSPKALPYNVKVGVLVRLPGGLSLWRVDGSRLRVIDEAFQGRGHHYSHPYIPEHELWVDGSVSSRELMTITRQLIQDRARGQARHQHTSS